MRAPGVYYPGVSALRGFAALLVVVQHAGYLAAKTAGVNHSDVVKIDLGVFGVLIFFTISGFVIGLNRRLPTGEFIVRRALRIYPAYWVAYATSALILLLVGKSTGFSWAAVFLLPSRTYPDIDLPIWTLVFEVFFYALAAAMFSLRLSDRALAGFALCWIIAIAHMQPYVTQPAQPGALIPVAQYNIFFALGLLCALKLDWLSRFTVSQLLGVAVVATAVLPLLPAASQVTTLLVLGVGLSSMLVAATRGDQWPRSLVALGDASYGLFLLHYAGMVVAASWLAPHELGAWALWAILVLVGMVFGVPYGLAEFAFHHFARVAVLRRLQRLERTEPGVAPPTKP